MIKFAPHIVAILADTDLRRRPPAGSLAELERDHPKWTPLSVPLSRVSSKSWTEPTAPVAPRKVNE